MSKIKVERRGTRHWVVSIPDPVSGIHQVIHECITKREALKYINAAKRSREVS